MTVPKLLDATKPHPKLHLKTENYIPPINGKITEEGM